MNILRRVPNSVLWLLEYPADAKDNLWKEAEARGIERGRIIFTPKASKHEHIERCHLADLSLDNPITNGHTTTVDLLWSGLP
jgi:protein O-GlcNAc transferase